MADEGLAVTAEHAEPLCATCGARVTRGDFFYRCRREAEVAVLLDPMAYLSGGMERHQDGSVTLDVCLNCYIEMDPEFGSRQRHQKT